MSHHVAVPAASSVEKRLAIYANAYPARLLEALADNFPMLKVLLGDDQFVDLGRGYLRAHPSQHYSVRWFGASLPDYIGAQRVYQDYPVIAEMAAFEWAMTLAFDAEDVVPMRPCDIETIPAGSWPEMIFKLHPAVQTLALFSNAPAVWQALQKNEPPPEVMMAIQASPWIVWRQDLMVYFRRLAENETPGFEAMSAAQNFSAICHAFVALVGEDEAASHAARVVQQWITDGLVRSPCI